jgi:hypothetical protein
MANYNKPNKDAFKRYVIVQKSGEFNMLDYRVQNKANITAEEHLYIIVHYDELSKEYGINMDNIEREDN